MVGGEVWAAACAQSAAAGIAAASNDAATATGLQHASDPENYPYSFTANAADADV